MRFSGRPRGKVERHQFRVSWEALRASVSSSVKWGQQSFSPVWSCQLCSGAPACLLTSTLPPLHSVMSFWWLGLQWEYFHHVCVRVCVCAHACVCASSITRSCPTLCDSVDSNPPGFPIHGGSPGKNTRACCHSLLQGIFLTQQ